MYCSEKCLEKHLVVHSLECGWMNLIESFPEAGMLLQAIAKDPGYLEKNNKIERENENFPIETGNKYQFSFCDPNLILGWDDSSNRNRKSHGILYY